MDLSHAIIKEHALLQMARRQIAPEEVRAVLDAPQGVRPVRLGRVVAAGI